MKNFKQLRYQIMTTDPIAILNELNIPYKQKNPNSYLLNIRDEKTPSAYISYIKGKWIYKDFGSGEGGSIYNVVMNYLHVGFKDASMLIEKTLNMDISQQNTHVSSHTLKQQHIQEEPKLKIKSKKALNAMCKEYLHKRGIKNISPYFSLITAKNGDKEYFGVGLTNESEGANIHFLAKVGNLKTINIGKNDISVVGDEDDKYLSIFESKMDYASAFDANVAYGKSIIAHSVVNAQKIQDYIKENKPRGIFLYYQNDEAGREFAKKISDTAKELNCKIIGFLYKKDEKGLDINDIHKKNINLRTRLVQRRTDEKRNNLQMRR